MENLVSFVFVSLVIFGAALDPDFGGVVFWVVREIAKVVKKEVILGDSWSSSESEAIQREGAAGSQKNEN
jgi:hypothetical protein